MPGQRPDAGRLFGPRKKYEAPVRGPTRHLALTHRRATRQGGTQAQDRRAHPVGSRPPIRTHAADRRSDSRLSCHPSDARCPSNKCAGRVQAQQLDPVRAPALARGSLRAAARAERARRRGLCSIGVQQTGLHLGLNWLDRTARDRAWFLDSSGVRPRHSCRPPGRHAALAAPATPPLPPPPRRSRHPRRPLSPPSPRRAAHPARR